MATGHVGALHVHGTSAAHRLAAQSKIVATLVFVVGVVVTPRNQMWAFGLYAAIVALAAGLARVSPGTLLRRCTIELPFIAFAVFLPFIAGGDRTDVGPLALSIDGLWAAWNIVAKGTLGVAASVVLTACTTLPDLIRGLERLHAPRAVTSIMSFMVRYGEVLAGEAQRQRIARLSRGHDPRWFTQIGPVARSAGTLFVRSYERGERVWLAMRSRGYDGSMPRLAEAAAPRTDWPVALALPVAAIFTAVVALVVSR